MLFVAPFAGFVFVVVAVIIVFSLIRDALVCHIIEPADYFIYRKGRVCVSF